MWCLLAHTPLPASVGHLWVLDHPERRDTPLHCCPKRPRRGGQGLAGSGCQQGSSLGGEWPKHSRLASVHVLDCSYATARVYRPPTGFGQPGVV